MVVVELTGRFCNAKCVWCYSQYKSVNKIKPGFMSLENFKCFLALNKGLKMTILPYCHGEPVINPEFPEIINYAVSEGRKIGAISYVETIHTNLAMDLTQKHLEALSKSRVVTVNVGGGTEETHFRNMKTDLAKVLSNIKSLVNVKRETNSKVIIQVKMVRNKRNLNQLPILRTKINQVDPLIQVFGDTILFACSDSDNEDKLKFIRENLTPTTPCRDWWRIQDGKVKVVSKLKRCWGTQLTVRWDGAVNVCCRVRSRVGTVVGNAFQSPLKAIMASPAYRRTLALAKKRRYCPFCAVCS